MIVTDDVWVNAERKAAIRRLDGQGGHVNKALDTPEAGWRFRLRVEGDRLRADAKQQESSSAYNVIEDLKLCSHERRGRFSSA